MDGNEKLQAAFQVECAEHLEGIRAFLTRLPPDATLGRAELDDAFRRAHSLKGAARIVGAAEAEQLAHQLESLFDSVRRGDLTLEADGRCLVGLALDAIEDSASSLANDMPGPTVQPVSDELRRMTERGDNSRSIDRSPDLARTLRAAFEEEYPGYVREIRSFLDAVSHGDEPSAAAAEESLRCAHSLKGAARIAGVAGADALAKGLERALSRLSRGQAPPDADAIMAIRSALDAIKDCAAVPRRIDGEGVKKLCSWLERPSATESGGQSAELPTIDGVDRPLKQPDEGTRAPLETVRLHAEHLDRLLRSTGELVAEGLKQDLVSQELNSLSRQISSIECQWKSLRKLARGARHAPAAETTRLVRGVEALDERFGALLRQARSLRLLQRRNAWSLRLAGETLQRDARQTRMSPAESAFQSFRKMMRDLARDEGKQIDFRVKGFETEADRMVLQALKDPLMHILRNAVTHGIEIPADRRRRGKPETGLVTMTIQADGNRLTIAIADDGRGIDLALIADAAVRQRLLRDADAASASADELARLLFKPGFSTASSVTELSGRGMGLSVVQEAVSRLQGEVQLRQGGDGITCIWLSVPLTIATQRVLLVSCQGQTFAIPVNGIESLRRIKPGEIENIEGKPMVVVDGELVHIAMLARLLAIESDVGPIQDVLLVAVLRCGGKRLAVVVDALLAERDSLIKRLGEPLASLKKFCGGVLLGDGVVALALDPVELIAEFRSGGNAADFRQAATSEPARPANILVVDDSVTTRTLETSILETHGYRVQVAVDGLEALAKLRAAEFDLVITDVQMPALDGFGLVEEIKRDARLARIPVIIVSSVERDEDQRRGLSLGADAYIVKRKFDHQDLLQTIQQLV